MGAYLSQPNTQKNTRVGSNTYLSYCCSEMQGWRRNMEDSSICEVRLNDGNSLFGVFDGHGGPEVSQLVKDIFTQQLIATEEYKNGNYAQALQKTFMKIDAYIVSQIGQRKLLELRYQKNSTTIAQKQKISEGTGCTANVILVTRNKLYVGNAGDSRSALFRKGQTIQLSADHKPQIQSQIQRITQAGGSIVMGRVNGGLNLTRAFGDFRYKNNKNLPSQKQMIICKPDIKIVNRDSTDQFILIGCDGIWQRYINNSQGLLLIVKQMLKKQKNLSNVLENLLNQLIATQTSQGIGCDNMTAILITFT